MTPLKDLGKYGPSALIIVCFAILYFVLIRQTLMTDDWIWAAQESPVPTATFEPRSAVNHKFWRLDDHSRLHTYTNGEAIIGSGYLPECGDSHAHIEGDWKSQTSRQVDLTPAALEQLRLILNGEREPDDIQLSGD